MTHGNLKYKRYPIKLFALFWSTIFFYTKNVARDWEMQNGPGNLSNVAMKETPGNPSPTTRTRQELGQ